MTTFYKTQQEAHSALYPNEYNHYAYYQSRHGWYTCIGLIKWPMLPVKHLLRTARFHCWKGYNTQDGAIRGIEKHLKKFDLYIGCATTYCEAAYFPILNMSDNEVVGTLVAKFLMKDNKIYPKILYPNSNWNKKPKICVL